MHPDYRKTPGLYRTEGTDFQRFSVGNPLIYLAAKERDTLNKTRKPPTTTPIVPSVYDIPLEDNKRLYARVSLGVAGSGDVATWLEQTDTTVATFQGTPLSGARAYPWESNPTNPTTSSPWHNVIYETTVDLYNWGARAIFLYLPFGSFNHTFFLTPQTWKRTYKKSSSDASISPARWKGFIFAVKSLLEGTFAPSGKTAMTEPCNVCIYHPSNRGYYAYRNKSNDLWDSLDGNSDMKDERYYEYLDDWINDLINIKSNQANAGKFSIILDAVSPSATTATVSLFRTMPDYRSDLLELSDWYVFNRLKDAGIDVYYEARAPKTINQANVPTSGSGTIGSYLTNEWYTKPFAAEEYWYWFSNPSNSDENYDNYAADTDTHSVFRILNNNFPLPANKDPYGVDFTTFEYSGYTKNFLGAGFAFYTPHFAIWHVYALSDNYRKYYNIREGTNTFTGIQGTVANQMSYFPEWFVNGNLCLSVYNGVNDPLMKYWRLPSTTVHYRPLFNDIQFVANPSTYSGGYWSQLGKDYWDLNVRKNSFSALMSFLNTYSLAVKPSDQNLLTAAVYGSASDYLYNGVLDYTGLGEA